MYPGTTFSDAPYTMPAGTTYTGQIGTLTAARIVTLPAANSVTNGTVVMVKDESGTASATNTISVARAGADTINGGSTSLVIDGSGGGYVRLTSNGATAWTGAVGVPLTRQTSGLLSGLGTPLGVVVANIGSIYMRLDGGAATTLYVKESGNGASTGWVAK